MLSCTVIGFVWLCYMLLCDVYCFAVLSDKLSYVAKLCRYVELLCCDRACCRGVLLCDVTFCSVMCYVEVL